MSERSEHDGGTSHAALAARKDHLCARFEAAWQETLKGSPQPSMETYLAGSVDPEHSALLSELRKIEQKYRRLMASGLDPSEATESLELPHAADSKNDFPQAALGSTIEQASEELAESESTAEFETSSHAVSLAEGVQESPDAARPMIPGYEILGELGHGSMGVVYKARQKGLNRLVALKMVLAGAHAAPDRLARFNVEAQAVATLQHPNIVQIYEVGQRDGLPFFSLEYIDGGTLSEKFANQPQPAETAAQMVETLARAMDYAHQHGIVHRDLKPSNVMLTSAGAPKITDFGLAKRLEDDSVQTKSGTILGTPSYMAPEQARGEAHEVGPLADVYALGAMLYALLTGRPPFLGASVMETIRQVLNDEPVPPSRLQPKVPRDLETICLKCLQKEPPKRYSSAGALADDLGSFLAGQPIRARPINAPERLWRWCRRNPKLAGLTAVVFALLITVAITSTGFALKISQEKEETERQRKLAELAAADEKAARLVADQKTKEAEASLKLAYDSAKLAGDTFFKVAIEVQRELKDKPGMDDLRRTLLNEATKGLDLVAGVGKDAAIFGRTRGGIHQRKGDILVREGRTAEALKEYQQGLTVFESMLDRLPADSPDREIAKFNAAVMHDKIGEASHQLLGSATAARDSYRQAMVLREALAAGPLKNPEVKPELVQRVLGGSYLKLGNIALALGDPRAAKEYHQKALTIFEATWKAQPKNQQAKQAVSGAYAVLGDISFRLRDPQSRRDYYQKALGLRQELAAANPQSMEAQRALAATFGALGDVELQLRNPRAAAEHYRQSHVRFEQLHRQEPKNVETQRELSLSHYRLGTTHLYLGELNATDKQYRESLKLREAIAAADPSNVHKQAELMLAEARCGLHAKAAERADRLRSTPNVKPDTLYCVGCGYALCAAAVMHDKDKPSLTLTSEEQALQTRYTNTALELLQKVITQGYNDVVTLEVDPDLDPIREHEGFKSLLEKLKAR